MSGRLSGHVAFVTFGAATGGDATGGDGRNAALARALVDEGALVVLVSRDDEAATGPTSGGRLADAVGARAVFCPGDDAEADARALVELTEDLLRRRGPASRTLGQ